MMFHVDIRCGKSQHQLIRQTPLNVIPRVGETVGLFGEAASYRVTGVEHGFTNDERGFVKRHYVWVYVKKIAKGR